MRALGIVYEYASFPFSTRPHRGHQPRQMAGTNWGDSLYCLALAEKRLAKDHQHRRTAISHSGSHGRIPSSGRGRGVRPVSQNSISKKRLIFGADTSEQKRRSKIGISCGGNPDGCGTEIHPLCLPLRVLVRQVAIYLANQHATVLMSHPPGNCHKINSRHHAVADEVVPQIVKSEP